MTEAAKADRVFISDTTLRDGVRSAGVRLDAGSRLRLARQLERLGVDVIEAGFHMSSPAELEACRKIAREVRGVTVAAFAQPARGDIDAAWSAIKEAGTPLLHIGSSATDVREARELGMTRRESVKHGAEMVAYARSLCENVQYSPEDAARVDRDHLLETVEAVIAAGASVINIADTTGHCLPAEFGDIVRRLVGEARGADRVLFSVHCHNDLGLATANTLAAIAAGARRVECTIGGIGEGGGNTSLDEIVVLLRVRQASLGLDCGIDTTEIARTSRLVAELTGATVRPNEPVAGAETFAAWLGVHQGADDPSHVAETMMHLIFG